MFHKHECEKQLEQHRCSIEIGFHSDNLLKLLSIRNHATADIDLVCEICEAETPFDTKTSSHDTFNNSEYISICTITESPS